MLELVFSLVFLMMALWVAYLMVSRRYLNKAEKVVFALKNILRSADGTATVDLSVRQFYPLSVEMIKAVAADEGCRYAGIKSANGRDVISFAPSSMA